MKTTILTFLKSAVLLCLVFILSLLFLPRTYNVPPLPKNDNIQYWNLPTGSRIGYTFIAAKGEKKPYPIIYLHGGPGGCVRSNFVKTIKPLADEGYDVYLYDQIGGGYSDRLDNINDYTPARHVADLEEIIKAIGAEKVIFIGQSWGAILAVLFAADHQNQVEKIIFTCPGPIYPIREELAKLTAPDSLHLKEPIFTNAQGNKKVNNWRTRAIKWWAEVMGKKLVSDKEADNFSDYSSYEVNKSTVCDTSKISPMEGGSGFYCGFMTFKNLQNIADPRSKLKNCPIPILMMKGQCDNQKWGYSQEYLTIFPRHQLTVIPNAGHAIATEQPDLYLKTIKTYLSH